MRLFKRIRRALDAFLAPDDSPVRSSQATDAAPDAPPAPSPRIDAREELRESSPSDSPPPPTPPDEFDYDDATPPRDSSDGARDGLDDDTFDADADDDDAGDDDYLPDGDLASGDAWHTPPPRVKRRRAVIKRVDDSSRGRSPTSAIPGSGTSRASPRSPTDSPRTVRVGAARNPNRDFHAAHVLHRDAHLPNAKYGVSATVGNPAFVHSPAADALREGIADQALAAATVDLSSSRHRDATNAQQVEQLNRHWFNSEFVIRNDVNVDNPCKEHVAAFITHLVTLGTMTTSSIRTLINHLKNHVVVKNPDSTVFQSPTVKAAMMGARARQSGQFPDTTQAVPARFIFKVLQFGMAYVESFEERNYTFAESFVRGNKGERYDDLVGQGLIYPASFRAHGRRDPGINIVQVREFRDALMVATAFMFMLRGCSLFDLKSRGADDNSRDSNIWIDDGRVVISLHSLKNMPKDIIRSATPRYFPRGIIGNQLAKMVNAWFLLKERLRILQFQTTEGIANDSWINFPGARGVTDRGKNAASVLGNALNAMMGRFPIEGRPGTKLSSHSLRKGGATAMYAAGCSIDIVKWWGMWKPSSSTCETDYVQLDEIHLGGEAFERDARLVFGDFVLNRRDCIANMTNGVRFATDELNAYTRVQLRTPLRRLGGEIPLNDRQIRERVGEYVSVLNMVDATVESPLSRYAAYGLKPHTQHFDSLFDLLYSGSSGPGPSSPGPSSPGPGPSSPGPSSPGPGPSSPSRFAPGLTTLNRLSPACATGALANVVPVAPNFGPDDVIDQTPASPQQKQNLRSHKFPLEEWNLDWSTLTRYEAHLCLDYCSNVVRYHKGHDVIPSNSRLLLYFDPAEMQSAHKTDAGSISQSQVTALRRWTVTLDEINQIVPEGQRKIQSFEELSSRQAHAIINACIREKDHRNMRKTMLLTGRVQSETRSARTLENRGFDSPLPR